MDSVENCVPFGVVYDLIATPDRVPQAAIRPGTILAAIAPDHRPFFAPLGLAHYCITALPIHLQARRFTHERRLAWVDKFRALVYPV